MKINIMICRKQVTRRDTNDDKMTSGTINIVP
jgi:hypothetical protein